MSLKFMSKYSDFGLLVLRLVIGVLCIYYGAPKIFLGPVGWADLGNTLKVIGIVFYPAFWGLAAIMSGFVGGFFFIIGFMFRTSCVFLFLTMLGSTAFHINKGHPFLYVSQSIAAAALFFCLMFVGPGKLSVDKG